MDRLNDVLFTALALKLRLVTGEDVLACRSELVSSEPGSMAARLVRQGCLSPAVKLHLEGFCRVLVDDLGRGDPGKVLDRLGLEPDHRKALAELASPGLEGETVHDIRNLLARGTGDSVDTAEAEVALFASEASGGGGSTVDAVPTRDASKAKHLPPPKLGATLRPSAEGRYAFKRELGRGGLGRVVEAIDTDFGREVAVKMMLSGRFTPHAVERFLVESRLAGRLSHPNIVPIYEMGLFEGEDSPTPYFTMAKIVGRDLAEIIEKRESTRQEFNRPRLLRIFQEVCQAMAYAHDNGVVHRDLKPSNIMVGDYGEVYVVDWGLAKLTLASDVEDTATSMRSQDLASLEEMVLPPSGKPATTHVPPKTNLAENESGQRDNRVLTDDGDVLGTPAYMPPEQAAGRIADVDARSDIYSLGAILYQILTFRPPFEEQNLVRVLARVMAGEFPSPSIRVARMYDDVGMAPPPSSLENPASASVAGTYPATDRPAAQGATPFLPPPIPQELEEICMKAMAREKADRYQSARQLAEEIQLFLEGEKERERNREKAMHKVAEGRKLEAAHESLRAEYHEINKDLEEQEKQLKTYWPIEKKAPVLALRWRAADIERQVIRVFGEAAEAYQEALGFDRHNPEARSALADLYWRQFVREEDAGATGDMIFFESLVHKYNDGQFDERLRGDGTLSVFTAAYSCACLTQGREVEPEELGGVHSGRFEGTAEHLDNVMQVSGGGVLGFHPYSGRPLGDGPIEGLLGLEPHGPVRLKVHGRACRPGPVTGARVWLFRFEEENLVLLPLMPVGVGGGTTCRIDGQRSDEKALRKALETLYERSSPYRPEEGLYLGTTPIAELDLPMGSYLLIVAAEGYRPVRLPVMVDRLRQVRPTVTLYRESEIPDEFVQIAGGPFTFQGDRGNPFTNPKAVYDVPDVFVARHHVTCAQYREFLNHLTRIDEAEAADRAPRATRDKGVYWPMDDRGKWHVPTETWLAGAPEDLAARASKLNLSQEWWRDDWPVFSISWKDLMAYAAWARQRTGHLITLPHELFWEKAARGTDRRPYPWGRETDATFANMAQSHEEGRHPCPIDGFPTDESPYGVRGMAGNAMEFCLNNPERGYAGWRVCRGAYWSGAGVVLRSTYRTGSEDDSVFYYFGGRLCLVPALDRQATVVPGQSVTGE